MTRLPTPGGDTGNWGTILNEYLLTAHSDDGSLKSGIVAGGNIANGAVTTDALADASVTMDK